MLSPVPGLHETITLTVTVHVVGDGSQFAYAPYRDPARKVLGYATDKEIWVIGKRDKQGRIWVNQAVLGHETQHHLRFGNIRIANPDDPLDYGILSAGW